MAALLQACSSREWPYLLAHGHNASPLPETRCVWSVAAFWRLLFVSWYLCLFVTTAQLTAIMCSTGVSLDPCYTLKGVRGMLGEMQTNPARFKGRRILYLHTGEV